VTNYEEMKAIREKVRAALGAAGFRECSVGRHGGGRARYRDEEGFRIMESIYSPDAFVKPVGHAVVGVSCRGDRKSELRRYLAALAKVGFEAYLCGHGGRKTPAVWIKAAS